MSTQSIDKRFQSALEHLHEALRGIRTGRASTSLLEPISVELYGSQMRIRDVASVTVSDAQTVLVEPWDKTAIPFVTKAIETSSLGISPVVSGTVIRIPFPPLTEERRQQFRKIVRESVEDARISVRNIRERELKDLKRKLDAKELSEDEFESGKKDIQKHVDEAIAAIEEVGRTKEESIMET